MQILKSCLWRQIAGLMPVYRKARQKAAKHVIPPLRIELLSDHLLRDLGLRRREADVRHPRL